jgi:hypothetical protein
MEGKFFEIETIALEQDKLEMLATVGAGISARAASNDREVDTPEKISTGEKSDISQMKVHDQIEGQKDSTPPPYDRIWKV